MENTITFVGLDVHKSWIYVAMLVPGEDKAVEWKTPYDGTGLSRVAKKIKKIAPGRVRCAYEAGPCGYAPQRALTGHGLECKVVAPAQIPVKPGERIKTDRRDARNLAELLRAQLLTEVQPPTPKQEAVRDLCRAREDAKEDLQRHRHRMTKMLLRRGEHFAGNNWTHAHRQWLRGRRFEEPAAQAVFDDYLRAIEHTEERVKTLEEKLDAVSCEQPYVTPVGMLRCFRGIDTVTAMTLVSELHGFQRFETPRALMAYIGLVPSERSSGGPGGTQRRGGITKTGNAHVRRILVEAAWHYRKGVRVGRKLRRRREGQPGWVISHADKAQHRLHRRYWRLVNRGKETQKATTAVARELVGFVWYVLYRHALETA